MKRIFRVGSAALAALALVGAGVPGPQGAPPRKRDYAMGFTILPYDVTPEALQGTLDFVKGHSDLVSFNLTDGGDRKSTRLNSSHLRTTQPSRMPSSA
jgi:hypothetical protein